MFHHFKHIAIHKSVPLVILLVVLVGLEYDDSGLVSADAAGEIRCVEREREALLRFKQGLTDDYGYLSSSWGSADCCDWNGVDCSYTTGHVTGIDLNTYGIGADAGEIRCVEREREALLRFKQGLTDDNGYLSWWGSEDDECCEWYGVECSNTTGHVTEVYLNGMSIGGTAPASLGQLSTLEYLDISADSLQGTVSESLLSKLHNLYWLDLSFNSLTLDLSPDWIPPFRLETITLASCKMGPSFPTWLRTQTNISDIDISDAGISDKVPNWLWSLSSKVTYFNLSRNHLTGTIPDLSSNFFGKIDFSSNKFSGPLPLLHPNVSLARFSQNMFSGSIPFICRVFNSQMVLLDLSDNQLEGKLPNCWDNSRDLTFLNLNNNFFDGEIPHGLGSLRSLETLQLRGNNLSGKIPQALKNCTNLILIDVGGNKLEGVIPPWLGVELTNLTHLSFRQNRFHGGIPLEMCHLSRIQMLDLSGNNLSEQIPSCFDKFSSLADKNGSISESISFYIDFKRSYYAYVQVQWKGNGLEYRKTLRLLKLIDLSNNRLVGNIPEAFSSLRGLISLNLSRNSLTGRLDPNIGEMEMLESLDLSNNQLSGKIPVGLARLNYLSVLDLANNSLSGQIPLGTQLGLQCICLFRE